MNQLDPDVIVTLRHEIIRSIQELLETKHLYQSVRIDTTNVKKLIDDVATSQKVQTFMEHIATWAGISGESPSGPYMPNPSNPVDQYIQELRQNRQYTSDFILESFWDFSTDTCNQLLAARTEKIKDAPTDFVLPTISVLCKKCNSIQPHNSGFRGQTHEFQTEQRFINKGGIQVPVQTFVFPYECQKCKEEPLLFLVHREGSKLRLVGRNHFEKVQVPKTIPKEEAKYFSDAIVAFKTGNVLAGLFLLRTTIEQYMRRKVKVTGKKRIKGEELAEEYAKYLPDNFPQRYPSMKTIYEKLSIALHSADANSIQFEKSKEAIEGHFDLLKHYPLRKRKRSSKSRKQK